MEDAFRTDRRMQERAPWQFSWQKNERNLTFDDPLKIRMIKGFAAQELGIGEEVRGWLSKKINYNLKRSYTLYEMYMSSNLKGFTGGFVEIPRCGVSEGSRGWRI